MRTALVAGASGLIGRKLVQKLIDSDQYRLIFILSRKNSWLVNEKVRELVIDFEQINQLKFDEPIDDLFCTLGTTIKQAGSRDNFMKVDYEYIIEFAKLGKSIGATKFLVISAMGANSKSSVFYNRVKGMTEEALKSIGFSRLVILRPSLLLGERPEPRFGEQIASFFMKALNFLIPDNYKAIRAEKVADNMLRIATDSAEGISIVESGEMIRN